MNELYRPTLSISLHYTPELHEKIKPILEHIEKLATEREIVPKMTPSFNTKPHTQYNKNVLHTYFASPSESIVVSTVLMESDFKKLSDMEWIEAITDQDNAIKAFHADLKQYVQSLK